MTANRGQVACVIVEPVAGNMGVVLPRPGFLETLRERTQSDGALLIFDEVITGFRLAYGGAQERFGITPDLTILGKNHRRGTTALPRTAVAPTSWMSSRRPVQSIRPGLFPAIPLPWPPDWLR